MIKSTNLLLIILNLFIALNLYPNERINFVIMDFANTRPSTLNQSIYNWIPSRLQEQLVRSKQIRMIERTRLDEILKEQTFSQIGVINEATAVKVGKLTGAQKLITGEIQEISKEKLSINTRMIDIEQGTIDGQWLASEISKDEINSYLDHVAENVNKITKNFLALKNLTKLVNPNSTFTLKMSGVNQQYKFGDAVQLCVESDQNCYLYLFDIGTSGKIHLLFPNKNQPNNFIKKNEICCIDNIRVGPPSGKEVVKAIATLDSISLQKMMNLAATSATYQFLGDDLDKFSRDLEVFVSPLKNERWTTSSCSFEIQE